MKVALIFTGGTIGTVENDDGVRNLDNKNNSSILGYFRDTDVIVQKQPYPVLSENLNGGHISSLIECVKDVLEEDHDGIIITHGTDTIQYTAAALSYAFGSKTVPIMVVSSNAPLDSEESNGGSNIAAAIDFIRNDRGTGVFVPYRNYDGFTYVHRGTRLLEQYEYDDTLSSIRRMPYGKYDPEGNYIENKEYFEFDDGIEPIGSPNIGTASDGIAVVCPRAAAGRPIVPDDITDLILNTYHSGTLCTDCDRLGNLIKRCNDNDITVWVTGRDDSMIYESMSDLKGIIYLPPMTEISAYVKIWMFRCAGRDMSEVMKPLGGDIVRL